MIRLLTDTVLTVTMFQMLVLVAVLLHQHPGHGPRRNLLVAFLLAKSLLLMRWFAYRFDLLEAVETPFLFLVSGAGFFLLAPLLYLHVRALCYRDFRLRRSAALHLLPGAAVALLATLAAAAFRGLQTGLPVLDAVVTRHFWRVFWAANFVQILAYIAAMFLVVARYRLRLREVFSSVRSIDLGWLQALLVVISLHWLFVTSRATVALLDLHAGGFIAVMDLLSITIFLVFTTALVVRGLALVRLFPGVEEGAQANGAQLDPAQVRLGAERLEAHMGAARPHLTLALRVDDLAQQLAMPAWQLSRVINATFRQNFFTFVNSYRVEEAKRQLGDPAMNHKTMLQILHESGFNSKATFNDAFKRHTGMTPSEFRHQRQRATDVAPLTQRQASPVSPRRGAGHSRPGTVVEEDRPDRVAAGVP